MQEAFLCHDIIAYAGQSLKKLYLRLENIGFNNVEDHKLFSGSFVKFISLNPAESFGAYQYWNQCDIGVERNE